MINQVNICFKLIYFISKNVPYTTDRYYEKNCLNKLTYITYIYSISIERHNINPSKTASLILVKTLDAKL